MTIDQKRDRVAELLGWKKLDTWFKCNEPWIPIGEGHPIPTTIDGIAALWREHLPDWGYEISLDNWWTSSNEHEQHLKRVAYQAVAHKFVDTYGQDGLNCVIEDQFDTEYEARLTLLLAVLEAKGTP